MNDCSWGGCCLTVLHIVLEERVSRRYVLRKTLHTEFYYNFIYYTTYVCIYVYICVYAHESTYSYRDMNRVFRATAGKILLNKNKKLKQCNLFLRPKISMQVCMYCLYIHNLQQTHPQKQIISICTIFAIAKHFIWS